MVLTETKISPAAYFSGVDWIQDDLLNVMANQRWGISGRLWTGNKGEACWLGDRVHALPQAKRGKLRARHLTHLDPTCWHIPAPVNT